MMLMMAYQEQSAQIAHTKYYCRATQRGSIWRVSTRSRRAPTIRFRKYCSLVPRTRLPLVDAASVGEARGGVVAAGAEVVAVVGVGPGGKGREDVGVLRVVEVGAHLDLHSTGREGEDEGR